MTTLYRFYDDIGTLLYVGITDRGPRRWREHMRDKDWWDQVATVRLESFDSRKDAETAELEAIRAEEPLFNIQGASGYRGGDWEKLPARPQSEADMAWRCEVCYCDLTTITGVIQLSRGWWHVYCPEHKLAVAELSEWTTDIVTWWDLREWQMHCSSKYAPKNNASAFGGFWEDYSHGQIGFFDEVVSGYDRVPTP